MFTVGNLMPALRKTPDKILNKHLGIRIYSEHPETPIMKYWQQLGQLFATMAAELEQTTLDMLMLENPLAVEIIEVLPENG
jgi:hypothetical protein